jgi:GNAT superfamily N-acetyltransferase
VPLTDRLTHTLTAEVPGLDEPWTIGAIVGPSGSGKTTLARAAFGEIHPPAAWPADLPIIECLDRGAGLWPAQNHTGRPEARPTIKQLARLLTAVGLGSVPAWLKPYQVLSTGERFRADLARAIQESGGRGQESAKPLVLDEFTSSLDRTVARTASAALSRLLRRAGAPRVVVLTCHDDILPWLAPDWTVELGGPAPRLIRCQPQPLKIPLRIDRARQSLWRDFVGQHYLTGGLAASATCYAAWIDSPAEARGPVAFCAAVAALGWKRTKRITRLVVRPEFQGLGIGTRLAESVAATESHKGHRVTITASHPAIVGHCSQSPRWKLLGVKKTGSTPQRYAGRDIRCSTGRAVASFEFLAGTKPGPEASGHVSMIESPSQHSGTRFGPG